MYQSTLKSDYAINLEEYTMLGGENGIFDGLADSMGISFDDEDIFARATTEGKWELKGVKFGFVKLVGDSARAITPFEYDEIFDIGKEKSHFGNKKTKNLLFLTTIERYLYLLLNIRVADL
ncbi:MAG: hypothetical protein U5M51_04400 [Emticicia sp.]|nr:hypothetical protein [Emticicia sp.]